MVDFSLLTHVTIVGAMATVPFYLFATYRSAGATARTARVLTLAVIAYGAVMTAFVVEWQFSFDSPYVVPAVMLTSLAVPTIAVLARPNTIVPGGITLPWLIGVQAFRVIGGLYLFEYSRGNVGPEFAYWAGIGDVVTGLAASALLLVHWRTGEMPRKAVYATILFGLADFGWAYAIGVLSLETPIQVFALDDLHATNRFSLAMIPFLLAPIAMAFMVMTLIELRRTRPTNVGCKTRDGAGVLSMTTPTRLAGWSNH
ncbi:MAG: hypothetical protein AAGC53_20370 [Actinomycetota bacterium]